MKTRESDSQNNCVVQKTLSILSSKWTISILKELCSGTKRFGELRKLLPEISPNTLTLRLRELEEVGIVGRQLFPEVPPRVEYSLTSRGCSLQSSVLVPLIQWGNFNLAETNPAEEDLDSKKTTDIGEAENPICGLHD
ncbi:MAG: winged helix-turn-helix transcriptional regulator [Chitinophagales bacterium]